MKFENPTMTISMFEVENIATTASVQTVDNVNEAVNEFIANNSTAGGQAGIKLTF